MSYDTNSERRVGHSLLIVFALTTACSGTTWAAQGRTRAAGAPIVLDATTTILIGADEPLPVLEAARDLASDFEKVLGQKPKLVQRPEEAGSAAIVIGYRSTPVQALRSGPAG